MDNVEFFKYLSTGTIVDAMKRMDKNGYGILYVVNTDNILIGSITDGDIRRWIIKGGKLKRSVREAMNDAPVFVNENELHAAGMIMRERQVPSLAVVDSHKRIVDVLFANQHGWDPLPDDTLANTKIIVMAGGKGTRLYPYTKILPKPLIPIGDIPILERILNRYAEYGVKEFYISINYRKEMIKSYFAESGSPYIIHYVEEDEPLGTAGSLRLISEKFEEPVIVTNCDILIEADYGDILKHHIESGNDLTIVSSLKNITIPYGVLHAVENGIITGMEEKPEFSNFVNTGMYVMNPECIDMIPEKTMYHMTQLADSLINSGKQVGMYPISESSFLDMGEFAEMKRMEERINAGFVE